jgi:glutamate formiminotransferase/formiminotetrahydrofolate cyclodeaminase
LGLSYFHAEGDMSTPLVECIPNFSEARRPKVVEDILQAVQSVEGVTVLDHSSDLDHNRTVITYVGEPAAVEEAAFRAIAKAAQLIDLDHHTGEHPRIGATDVVPFVPLAGISMVECVEMARRLGKRVGSELGIPVYLYEEAASRPDRHNLENIRRGEYEGLKDEIATNPDRQPDFGPSQLSGAGATVIGARQPLVAFNVYLTTNDVEVASRIAKAVRNSSGGMRFVKAMGVLVEGRAQVSMNLTNYRLTPIARVVELVRREAQRYGTAVHHTELIGMIPQEALVDAAVWHLQLDAFSPEQVLENRLRPLPAGQPAEGSSDGSFLDRLAAGTPTPGGGSAAAYAGAAAAALVAMVARLTLGKKKYAAVEGQMWEILEKADTLRKALTEGVEQDAASFEAYIQAVRLPRNTPEEEQARAQAIEQATRRATEVPFETAQRAVAVMALAVQAASLGNPNAICDSGTAVALGRAALTGAGLNVRTNTMTLMDRAAAENLRDGIHDLETQATGLEAELQKILKERVNIQL